MRPRPASLTLGGFFVSAARPLDGLDRQAATNTNHEWDKLAVPSQWPWLALNSPTSRHRVSAS